MRKIYLYIENRMVLINLHHLRMLCTKFGWNWPSYSWVEDFKISSMFFLLFTIIFPRKSVWSFILRKLNPFTQGCCVALLVKIGPLVLERKNIIKVRQCIFAIYLLSPLGKGHGLSFVQNWIHFTQGWLVLSLVEIEFFGSDPLMWKQCCKYMYISGKNWKIRIY